MNKLATIISCFLSIIPSVITAEVQIFSATAENSRIILCSYDLETLQTKAVLEQKNNSYISYQDKITRLNRKIKQVQNNRKLKNEKRTLKQRLENDNTICQNSRTPSPTPSATSSNNFDEEGNTIPGSFSIPVDLTGNINTGRSIYLRNCIGCHEERRYRNYNEINSAISIVPEMNGRLEDYEVRQAIANITAYLNR